MRNKIKEQQVRVYSRRPNMSWNATLYSPSSCPLQIQEADWTGRTLHNSSQPGGWKEWIIGSDLESAGNSVVKITIPPSITLENVDQLLIPYIKAAFTSNVVANGAAKVGVVIEFCGKKSKPEVALHILRQLESLRLKEVDYLAFAGFTAFTSVQDVVCKGKRRRSKYVNKPGKDFLLGLSDALLEALVAGSEKLIHNAICSRQHNPDYNDFWSSRALAAMQKSLFVAFEDNPVKLFRTLQNLIRQSSEPFLYTMIYFSFVEHLKDRAKIDGISVDVACWLIDSVVSSRGYEGEYLPHMLLFLKDVMSDEDYSRVLSRVQDAIRLRLQGKDDLNSQANYLHNFLCYKGWGVYLSPIINEWLMAGASTEEIAERFISMIKVFPVHTGDRLKQGRDIARFLFGFRLQPDVVCAVARELYVKHEGEKKYGYVQLLSEYVNIWFENQPNMTGERKQFIQYMYQNGFQTLDGLGDFYDVLQENWFNLGAADLYKEAIRNNKHSDLYYPVLLGWKDLKVRRHDLNLQGEVEKFVGDIFVNSDMEVSVYDLFLYCKLVIGSKFRLPDLYALLPGEVKVSMQRVYTHCEHPFIPDCDKKMLTFVMGGSQNITTLKMLSDYLRPIVEEKSKKVVSQVRIKGYEVAVSQDVSESKEISSELNLLVQEFCRASEQGARPLLQQVSYFIGLLLGEKNHGISDYNIVKLQGILAQRAFEVAWLLQQPNGLDEFARHLINALPDGCVANIGTQFEHLLNVHLFGDKVSAAELYAVYSDIALAFVNQDRRDRLGGTIHGVGLMTSGNLLDSGISLYGVLKKLMDRLAKNGAARREILGQFCVSDDVHEESDVRSKVFDIEMLCESSKVVIMCESLIAALAIMKKALPGMEFCRLMEWVFDSDLVISPRFEELCSLMFPAEMLSLGKSATILLPIHSESKNPSFGFSPLQFQVFLEHELGQFVERELGRVPTSSVKVSFDDNVILQLECPQLQYAQLRKVSDFVDQVYGYCTSIDNEEACIENFTASVEQCFVPPAKLYDVTEEKLVQQLRKMGQFPGFSGGRYAC